MANSGGYGGLVSSLAKKGRAGDTRMATVTPSAQSFLKAMGGSDTTNPWTGLTEFARQDNFDSDLYLANNPDVAAAGMDPWEHYNQFGLAEGRAGNAAEVQARESFDSNAYLNNNADVAASDMGAWQHFALFGLDEGRAGSAAEIEARNSGFNPDEYLNANPDVVDAGMGAWEHYSQFGQNEGRGANAQQAEARTHGYTGGFGSGGYDLYQQNYYDHDSDASTPWVARNASNIGRDGLDASSDRDALRELGYSGLWGAGGAPDFFDNWRSSNPDFDGSTYQDALTWQRDQDQLEAEQTLADQMQSWLQSIQESYTQQQDAVASNLSALVEGMLSNNQQSSTPDIYSTESLEDVAGITGGYQNMRPVFNPLTGRTEWVPINAFGGFYNSLVPGSTSTSANASRRGGFGNLIMV